MNYVNINTQKLTACAGLHSMTATRLARVHDRLRGKGLWAAALHPARHAPLAAMQGRLSAIPAVPSVGEEDMQLESAMAESVQKVLAIMAIIINDMQADLRRMEDMIAIVGEMDEAFFDLAAEDGPASPPRRKGIMEAVRLITRIWKGGIMRGTQLF